MVLKSIAVKESPKIKSLVGCRCTQYPFGIIYVNSNLLWNEGYTGVGIKVAVIDSGIYPHIDLQNRIAFRKNYGSATSITESHGTHVAGTIGAGGSMFGVMKDCTFYDLQILDSTGGTEENFSRAVDEAIRQKVDIINMSIGTPTSNSLVTNAIKRAYRAGIILVAAAGNDGENTVMYPGFLEECISVANLNINTNQVDGTSSSNRQVDCCAPGTNIISLAIDNKYVVYSGTSMACPHVSGLCGLYLQKSRKENPSFDLYQHRDNVVRMLYQNIVDVPPVGLDVKAGRGLVRYKPTITPSIDYYEKTAIYYIV